MKVNKSTIPSGSLTKNYLPTDYSDVYACVTDSGKEMSPDDIMVSFWTDFPRWINTLFKLRNFLVKLVGLKGAENDNVKELEECIRTGKTYDFVSVPAKSANETVLLLSDRHLDAYLSVYIEHQTISVITLVKFKNKLGRAYFFVIRPFHGLIAKSLLKRAVKRNCFVFLSHNYINYDTKSTGAFCAKPHGSFTYRRRAHRIVQFFICPQAWRRFFAAH
ncbi:MAG: DUF2867 domain-containing protein [Bacteroidetes bacterium]|nr:DUF2867 domain-containing protein [Bacteroidota bacterium]